LHLHLQLLFYSRTHHSFHYLPTYLAMLAAPIIEAATAILDLTLLRDNMACMGHAFSQPQH
jgi:hypothetical protein